MIELNEYLYLLHDHIGEKERKKKKKREMVLYFVTKWATLCSVFYRLVAGVVADTPVRPCSPLHRHLMFGGSHLGRVETEWSGEIIASRRVLSWAGETIKKTQHLGQQVKENTPETLPAEPREPIPDRAPPPAAGCEFGWMPWMISSRWARCSRCWTRHQPIGAVRWEREGESAWFGSCSKTCLWAERCGLCRGRRSCAPRQDRGGWCGGSATIGSRSISDPEEIHCWPIGRSPPAFCSPAVWPEWHRFWQPEINPNQFQ